MGLALSVLIGDLVGFSVFRGVGWNIPLLASIRLKVANTSGLPPLRAPLLNTATVGLTERMTAGLLLTGKPWCVDW
jgi:hypothetical protein